MGANDDQASAPATESDYPQLRGSDLARAALRAAREASGGPATNSAGTRNKQVRRTGAIRSRRRRWSGPSPDDRDPQPLGRIVSRLAADRGWSSRLTTGRLFGQWGAIVGEDVAEHARPMSLKDGELTIQAESTAWATQLRLLAGSLLQRIAAEVGHNVVTRLHIHGPAAPS